MQPIPTASRQLDQYNQWLEPTTTNQLTELATRLRGKKIYEVNATANGGGVAELLSSQLGLMKSLGLDADWLVIPPDDRFFATTKQLHNRLQGNTTGLVETEYYEQYLAKVNTLLPTDGDLYILHDPQTAGLIAQLDPTKVIWRCHIDTSTSDPATRDWLIGYVGQAAKLIFSLPEFAHGIASHQVAIVYPATDPLVAKNLPLTADHTTAILKQSGIDPASEFITQISRYDHFKDPLGVIRLHQQLQKTMPQLRCVLLGNYADDDPEGAAIFAEVQAAAGPNCHVLVNAVNNDDLVNALQSRAKAVIQYSNREGFGLTVTEAMWKSGLVFARPSGGIGLQILSGKTGLIATGDPALDATTLLTGWQDAELMEQLRRGGHEHVRKHFLTPIMLRDYLSVYANVLGV